MTEPQPELPDPAEYRREMVRVTRDMATVRRYLSAAEAEDAVAMAAIETEVAKSGRMLHVFAAMGVQCLDFGHVLQAGQALRDGDDKPITLQAWLDAGAFGQMDEAAEGERLLRDWDEL